MKLTKYFVPTRKEVPKEAETLNHQMMLRAGLVRQHLAGAYSILPLGWRVMRNIMTIIREEMERIGCQEFYLPVLSTMELWSQSGRWLEYGDDMFRLKDRKGRELCLAPTHEEVFAELASNELHSYRDLPQMWYQIQTKFRDEVRPRSGLLRVRQFFMKDAYSFDADSKGLDASYQTQRDAYIRIFERAGLNVRIVKASSGAMGGRDCEEFMVLSESGDDEIVNCPSCGYAANQEVAVSKVEKVDGKQEKLHCVHTPGKMTIEDVSGFLEVDPSRLVKSMVYVTEKDNIKAFVLVRGDHQVDEAKLEAELGECRMATDDEVKQITAAIPGFVSPVGINNVLVIADTVLEGTTDLVAGANQNGYHYTGVDISRDIDVNEFVPLRAVNAGEPCADCGEPLSVSRAIEVGHIFKLGTRYSEALNANFLDENGETHPIIMGSYGIGVERIMAGAIEAYFDGDAMVWPRELAPFLVEVLPLNVTIDQVSECAGELYDVLCNKGISVLMDDRDDRAGVKFKDADLIGAPILVVIGERGLKEGTVEVRVKDRDLSKKVSTETLIETVLGYVNDK
ncbi:proline--tRNA ligase [Candidatus Latescibacterota bacterium]